jgi:hypothetical protein
MNEFQGIFDSLGVSDTWKINHTEQGMGHVVIAKELQQMIRFINGGDSDDLAEQQQELFL